MLNCKKCGALIGKDFIFCGKCGEPVKNSMDSRKIAKAKKYTKINVLRKKIADSGNLNFIFAAVVFLIGAGFALESFFNIKNIISHYWQMGGVYAQYVLKYEYIKEGLSFSYTAKEFNLLADYVSMWISAVCYIITAISFFAVCVTRIIRGICVTKGIERKNRAIEKIELISGIVAVSVIMLRLIAFVVILYLKGRG